VQRPALGFFAIAVALVIAMLSLKALRKPGELAAVPTIMLPRGEPVSDTAYITMPQAIVPVPNVLRERITASVDEQPEVAARLVRAWMKEG
jgi:flagellar biosynthesis/type III secretory pathway M-ring protein FliF/YscJ